jgi:hypothetical protein
VTDAFSGRVAENHHRVAGTHDSGIRTFLVAQPAGLYSTRCGEIAADEQLARRCPAAGKFPTPVTSSRRATPVDFDTLRRRDSELIDAKLTTKKELNHPAVGSQLANLCRIWWHSLQSVIKLVSASSPKALRRLMW